MFYVYRFLDKDLKVIYIGRTVDIKARMTQHFGKGGHLPKECYDSVHRVDFLEFKTKNDMKIKELYYIGKYRPMYNTVDNHAVSFEMNELQDVWVTYSKEDIGKRLFGDSDELSKKQDFITHLKLENQELEKQLRLLKQGVFLELEKSRNQVKTLKKELSFLKQEKEMALESLRDMKQKIVLLNPFKKDSRLVSYERMVDLLVREPDMVGLRVVEGEVTTMLKLAGLEVHALTGLNTSKQHTIVLDSPNPKREMKDAFNPDILRFEEVSEAYTCDHWKPTFKYKPYKKGA